MADRTHFYPDLEPTNCELGCQKYDEEKDELHYCTFFIPDIPKDYLGDQNPLKHIAGKCKLKKERGNKNETV